MSKNDGQCIDEQLGFLWGIPLTIMASLISLVGMVVWILGMLVTLICPCLMHDTILVEVAAELVRAPLYTAECFTGSKRLPAKHRAAQVDECLSSPSTSSLIFMETQKDEVGEDKSLISLRNLISRL